MKGKFLNMGQGSSGEQCGPWASCLNLLCVEEKRNCWVPVLLELVTIQVTMKIIQQILQKKHDQNS
jgi:hypothetical protein